MAQKAWVGGRATENRDIAMDGQRRSGATGRGKTLLTKLALAPAPSLVTLHHSPRSITRPAPSLAPLHHSPPPQAVRLRTILARSKKLHIQYRCASQKPVHCPKTKTKKRRKHRKRKSPQYHDTSRKSQSRASASPTSLLQNILSAKHDRFALVL
jgi:hypothetical protein